MAKNPKCPECGERFQDGRGLQGHLRMSHGISGEEKDALVREALERAEQVQRQAEAQTAEMFGDGGESLVDVVKRVAVHRGESPLQVVKSIRRDQSGFNPPLELESGLLSKSEEEEAFSEILDEVKDQLEEERDEAEGRLYGMIQTEIQHR